MVAALTQQGFAIAGGIYLLFLLLMHALGSISKDADETVSKMTEEDRRRREELDELSRRRRRPRR